MRWTRDECAAPQSPCVAEDGFEADWSVHRVLASAKSGSHVDAHLLDAGGIAVVGFEIVGELGHGTGIGTKPIAEAGDPTS